MTTQAFHTVPLDWNLQVANIPAVITCSDVMAVEHLELAVTFMNGMSKAAPRMQLVASAESLG